MLTHTHAPARTRIVLLATIAALTLVLAIAAQAATATAAHAALRVTIKKAPKSMTRATAARFTFVASAPGVTLRCKIDGKPFATCTSGKTYTGLAAGRHSFAVRGTRVVGGRKVRATDTHAWTIDRTAPTLTLSNPGDWSTLPSLDVTASATDSLSGVASVKSRLSTNGGATYGSFVAGGTRTISAEGQTVVQFVATDRAGNAATATRTVKLDRTGPTVASFSYPTVPTNDDTPTVTFTAPTDAGVGVLSWSLERATATLAEGACDTYGAWTTVGVSSQPSPFTEGSAIGNGTCVLYRLIALDTAGHSTTRTLADPTAAAKIDTVAPTGGWITTPPTATDIGNPIHIDYAFHDAELGYDITTTVTGNYDWSACNGTSAITCLNYYVTAFGLHTFTLNATDAAGNTNSSVTASFTIIA